jgi:hypothetical protein
MAGTPSGKTGALSGAQSPGVFLHTRRAEEKPMHDQIIAFA